jgi:hypothetical protein
VESVENETPNSKAYDWRFIYPSLGWSGKEYLIYYQQFIMEAFALMPVNGPPFGIFINFGCACQFRRMPLIYTPSLKILW